MNAKGLFLRTSSTCIFVFLAMTLLIVHPASALLFDADLGLANIDLQIGIDPVYTLQDVVYGDCPLERAVVSVPKGPDVLAASSGTREMTSISLNCCFKQSSHLRTTESPWGTGRTNVA